MAFKRSAVRSRLSPPYGSLGNSVFSRLPPISAPLITERNLVILVECNFFCLFLRIAWQTSSDAFQSALITCDAIGAIKAYFVCSSCEISINR